jgi:parvulin-like peptidyl-prolyl isomerase
MRVGFRGTPKACWVIGIVIGIVITTLVGCSTRSTIIPPVPHATPTSAQSASPPTAIPSEPLAARVNGQPIYLQDYQKQVTEWEAAFVTQNPSLSEQERQAMLAQGRQQVLDVMIEQVLIEQAATQEGETISDEEVENVIAHDIEENGGREQFDAWLAANQWTYEEYKSRQRSMMLSSRMFERVTRNVPTKAEQVHARHILVATEPEARDILSQLQSGADFATLAGQHSLDPSTKDSGGDLGFFPQGTLVVPEVEEAAFSLAVGQISDIIHSAMGYHIVQVLERVQDMALTEDSWQALREATFRRWVSELWATANIEILISL